MTVAPSAAMAAKARSGSGDGSMTTRPPASKVPRMPGQASGKLCDAGSAVRYTVSGPNPHSSALARAL